MPQSPLLSLSPPMSPQKKTSGASLAGSRKAAIPPDAIRGFATVGSLVRSEHFAPQLDDNTTDIQEAQSRRGSLKDSEVTTTKKKPRKRTAVTPAEDGAPKSKPKPRARKPKADKDSAITRDPELRLPAPKVSPYFGDGDAQPPLDVTAATNEPTIKLTKSGKPRKPRAKKEKVGGGEAEPKIRKARVAKPKGAGKAVEKTEPDDACVQSAHFQKEPNTTDETTLHTLSKGHASETITEKDASIWEVPESPQPKKKRSAKPRPPVEVPENLDLDEAVSRRRDWTPPRDTVPASPFTDSVGKENKEMEPNVSGGQFTNMISNFAYAQLPASRSTVSTTASTTELTAVTKRRRVELVDVPSNAPNSRNSSPEKGKAPKKKARTITDIATEQYQPKSVDTNPLDVTSDFFQPQTTVTKVPLNDVTTGNDKTTIKKPPRKRSTSKSDSEKAGSKTKSKKGAANSNAKAKAKPIAEKLLSPSSALLRLSKQDVLFGTSSQLALEESPTLVRQLQQAMRESERDGDTSMQLMAPPRWPRLEKVVGRRGLWDVSARDVEGGLLDQMEDVYIPDFDRTQDFPLLMDGTTEGHSPDLPSFENLDDTNEGLPIKVPSLGVNSDAVEPISAIIISSDLPTPPRTTSQGSQTRVQSDHRDHVMAETGFEDIGEIDSQPPPSNQNAKSQEDFADIDDLLPELIESSTMLPPKPRPPAPGTPKRRGRPPKAQSAVPVTSTTPPREPGQRTPKRTQYTAKPKKTVHKPVATTPKSSGRFFDIDEILDSEDEAREAFSPTPPRVRRLADSEPLPLFSTSPTRAKTRKSKNCVDSSVVRVDRIASAHLEWVNFKSIVFAAITAHIRSLPPTTDPKKPSWHEKILMYDPIVLEEFTVYLNVSTVIRTWKRATKVQIKAWNKEMKALGEPALDIEGPNEVLAVEKELEAWQVQAWCESMSVCCIWGEGRGKGGVRKGFY
ncbi:structure-specific endonuclease subunit SLX4 [Paraphoma chrysanthemicola]|uniref:Structure-specific endonuclease subunit SLX4 n=1 Tax=Paraphoma chrysanthemicola TaxID=798071 RepID=A0A8K0RC68_9PLEO|nr:structure-specific endonuclease subunit SLX4 [Paraphoma chrysanthemicola]